MPDLERALRELAATEPWPPTPDLTTAVTTRLRSAPAPARARRPRRRWALIAAIAALVALPTAAVAFPGARDDVLEWLGLRSVEVRRTPTAPEARRLLPTPDLGPRVSLPEARLRAGFDPLVPAVLGPPDDYRVRQGRISLVYRPTSELPARRAEGIGLLVTEQFGEGVIAEKMIGPGTTVRGVDVGGWPGAWIAGRPHGIVFQSLEGGFREDELRLAGDTLVWERDDLVLRIEGAASLNEALRIARSFR